jgi:GH25 family lysozyme M1 (1,4-beta-N-acetylmuramidase)
MWQFSDAGHIDGIDGAVDMNHLQDGFINPVAQPVFTDAEKLDKLWNAHPDLWVK